MDSAKFREMFLTEATEHVEQMVTMLVQLDADPEDSDGIDSLFRSAHSIKGMAATMEHNTTAKLAHHLEDRLDNCRKRGHIDGNEVDWLLEATDLLELLLDDIRSERPERDVADFMGTTPVTTAAPVNATTNSATTLASDNPASRLIKLQLRDDVIAPGARLLVLLKRLADFGAVLDSTPTPTELLELEYPRQLTVRIVSDLDTEQLRQELEKYQDIETITFPASATGAKPQTPKAPAKTVRVNTELLDHLIRLTGELITNRYTLQNGVDKNSWQEVDDGVNQLARLIKNLHHHVLQVRMVSLEALVGRLTRTAHDLSRGSGKTVNLQVEGATIELDRTIVEALTDPLVHMVRNAIDHGIDTSGTIFIKAWREKDQIHIQVSDDGGGIDIEKVKQQALQHGLLAPSQVKTIRRYDLLQLICQPGFSTTASVSETSGRGVGMDVVKTAVEQVGGILTIESPPDKGAQITLKLPLSLAIIRVLMVECDGAKMALPITRVAQTVEISPTEVQSSGKQLMIEHHNELLPMLSLRKILNAPKRGQRDPIPIVITEVLGRRIALVVDRLVGQQEVFVQRLPEPFDQIMGSSGATILGDGEIVFLLDLQSLFEQRKKRAAAVK